MSGFVDIGVINMITDNLRDRYKSGFPVLKEIIQNVDYAEEEMYNSIFHYLS